MLKFIYFCMAIVALSFLIVPMIGGVNESREELAARTSLMAAVESEPSEADLDAVAEQLNEIQPAAGDDFNSQEITEEFSAEFEPNQHPAF